MGISREGDIYMRGLLVQCAQLIMGRRGPDCELKRFGLNIAGIALADVANKRKDRQSKKKMKIAVVAVARKLAVLMHRLWVSGGKYDPFYEANRKKRRAGDWQLA